MGALRYASMLAFGTCSVILPGSIPANVASSMVGGVGLEMVMCLNLIQWLKAHEPMLSIVCPISIRVRPVHLLKVLVLMTLNPFGRTIFFNLLQPSNAPSPSILNPSGSMMVPLRLWHPLNA